MRNSRTWKKARAKVRWQLAIRKVLQQNRSKKNAAAARRRRGFRQWAAKNHPKYNARNRGKNWLPWAKAKRAQARTSNQGYNYPYRFYRY